MPTPKQVLAQHIAEHHQRLHQKLGKRARFEQMSSAHVYEHWRFVRSHGHGPQQNRGPAGRPDGWYDGTHVVLPVPIR
jgi:hypothetical protein